MQKQVWQTSKAYRLDTKIENYKEARCMSRYRWDLDCIIDASWLALDDKKEYPDKNEKEYIQLKELYYELKSEYMENYKSYFSQHIHSHMKHACNSTP